MAKKKTKGVELPKNSALLALAVVGIIIVGAIALSNNQNLINKSEVINSVTPTTSLYPQDTENDGVYTNHQYGFTFSYPEDVFSYQDPKRTGELELIDSDLMAQGFDGKTATFLYSRVIDNYSGEFANPENTLYEKVVSIPVGGKIYDSEGREIGTKFRSLGTNNAKGVSYYYMTPEGSESISNHVYRAEWLKDGRVIAVYMLSGNKEQLTKRKQVFDAVVNSFKYISPSPTTK